MRKILSIIAVGLFLAGFIIGCGAQPSGDGVAGNTGGQDGNGYGDIVGPTGDNHGHHPE